MEARETALRSPLELPTWLHRLSRRILHLPAGRYQITLTVAECPDWTVQYVGKVEAGDVNNPATAPGHSRM
jgi:hypothetical protein